jgi:molybdopterin converting factor subunit 1
MTGEANMNHPAPEPVPSPVTLRVKLFALARQLAGAEEVELTVVPPVTVGSVREALAEQSSPLASLVRHSMFAVGTEYARDDVVVQEGDELALIPPVSGG